MPFGSIVGAIGGLIGGHQDREFARAQSAADRAFQKEVYQNQYQWKAEDARKAGLHPLAVIGGGSYAASPSSMPSSSSMADTLGKLGEGIGDAYSAYKNKDQIAAEAADKKKKEDENHEASINLLNAQADYYRRLGQTPTNLQSAVRSLSYSKPMASGRESMPGQVDAPPVRGSGTFTSDIPSAYQLTRIRPGRFDINYSPDYQQSLGDEWGQVQNVIDKAIRSAMALITGNNWNGMYMHSDGTWSYAPRYSSDRRSAFGKIRE